MKQKFGRILLNQMPFVTKNRNTFIPFGTNGSRTELAGPEFSTTSLMIERSQKYLFVLAHYETFFKIHKTSKELTNV